MHGHQTLRHRHFGKVADTAKVMRIGQRHDAAAVRLGARHAERHGLRAYNLAVAALAVQREHGADVEHRLHAGIGLEAAFQNGIDIAGQHADAV